MSDFLDNGPERKETEYSYSKGQINQGEGHYQWNPTYDNVPKKDKKPKSDFGKKMGRAVAIALVFGLVSGVTFQGATLVTGKAVEKYVKQNTVIEETVPQKEAEVTKIPETTTPEVATATGVNTVSDVSQIVENVMPAIVQVTNLGIQEYRTMFGIYKQDTTSAGSGIIISQDDDYIYIASNNHVVAGAETLTITFCDGEAVSGEIKGNDNSCDLAVIAVKEADIKPETLSQIKVATMGTSDDLMVGQGCVVIGNALGYGQSVTSGVISAKDRIVEITGDNNERVTNSLIQTDAAVNPGNSGGALLNLNGEVIGIVSAKYTNTSVEGVGYAIPIDYASSIIQQMISSDVVNEINASYIGIGGVDITSSLSEQYNLPRGVYIQQVMKDSGAEAAGLEQGDVITAINGRTVTSMSSIQNILQYISAGTTVDITVAKANNDYAETTIQVTLTHKNQQVQ